MVGFKDTPKYTQIYGRSKGEITGGREGKYLVMGEEEKKKAQEELKDLLRSSLTQKARDQIPTEFILLEGATSLRIDEENINTEVKDPEGKGELKMKGTLTGFLLDEEKLTRKIAETSIKGYNKEGLKIPAVRTLEFSFINKETIPSSDIGNLNFNLSGHIKIVWDVEVGELKENVLGKSKKDFPQILKAYPSIGAAVLNFRPFWKRSFPEKLEDIEVVINKPK